MPVCGEAPCEAEAEEAAQFTRGAFRMPNRFDALVVNAEQGHAEGVVPSRFYPHS